MCLPDELYFCVPTLQANREVEIKLRVSDLHALICKVQDLGAGPLGRVLERNTLYDTPSADLRSRGWLLRLRVEVPSASAWSKAGYPRTILTSKGPWPTPITRSGRKLPKPLYKEKIERERVLEASPRWESMLRSLGFRPGFRYEKYRTGFRLPGLHLDLDETPIGVFLELEGPFRLIDRAANLLGYSSQDYLRETYWDLYSADCRRRRVSPRSMVFHT